MYSKTMAQAVNEEPVEFQDTLVAPECDSCALRVAGFLENRFENLAPDNKEEASLETLPDISGIETCGANDVVTDPEDFPEKVMPLEEEGQICGLQAENTTAVPSFSIIQAQCKSEEDDGYCSRSSLDSPVQTSQSDSEANDPEVFALKETSTTSQSSPTDGPGTTQAPIEAFADCPGSLMSTASVSATTRGAVPAPTGVLSPYASHSAGPQKILIVNKTANVKYLIPTTGEVKSAGTSKTLSIPSVNPGPPPASPQLPNLVNLKILKPGLNKFCPGQITLLRVPDKETPGLSSVTVTRPLLKQPSSARTSPRTSSFIAVTGSQRDPNSQVTGGPVLALEKEIGHPAILQRTVCADAPFSLKYSAESSTSAKNDRTSTRLTADSLDEYGCLGNVECRSEATSGSSAVGQRSSASTYSLSPGGDAVSTVSYKAEASACLQAGGGGDALQPHPEGSSAQAVGNDADKSQLNAQPADDVIAAGAAQDCTISSLTDVRRNNHETVPRNAVIGSVGSLNRNGAQRPAVGCLQGRPPVEGISCHAISRSQVVVAAAGRDTGVLSVPKVDKFKKPFPMASFPLSAARMQDQVSATKASATSRAGPTAKSAAGENDSQKILTACLSSTSFVNEGSHAGSVAKLAINGQTGVTNKSSVYQLGGRNNQDVTVILLPQTSLHSIPKKTNPVNETTCKQVVLRIGPSQVFKAVSVNTDSLRTQPVKSDEKLGKAFGSEGSNGRDSAWLDAVSKKELAAESLSKTSQLNLALNKTTNVMAVVERAAASSKDAMSAAKQLPNPEKEILSLPKSSTSIGHFASLSLSSLQVASASGATDSSQRLTGGKQLPSSPASSKAGTTAVTTQFKGQKTVVQTGNVRGRANDVSNTGRNRISRQGLHTIRKSCQSVGYLHPLIDHDYCEFSAFCADVQSSIISLTDSSIRPERRYVKKNRAARTKAMRVSQYVSENCSTENRPKRKYCKRKQVLEAETGKKHGALNSKIKASGKVVASPSKGSASTGKDSIQSLTTSSDDKDYVKIPGHYQDEYVYYATKRLPGRPRNRADASNKASDVVVSKPPTTAAAGISMFDWYKEMAQTDKTSRFGAAEIADCSARGSYLEEPSTGKDCTPVDESDVADLVMDMLPSGDLVQPISDDMKFMSSSGIVDSLLSNPLDMGMLATSGGESSGDVGSTYLNLMAEEVRLMLSSMGEAELKLLESHLENEKITEEMHTDGLDINSYLGDYASHEANMSQSSVSNLLDVDDINDGDLLSADIANMNIILNDLNATNRAQATHDSTTAKLEAGGIGSIFDKGVNSCDDFMGGIHDIGLSFTSDAQAVNTSNPNKSFQRPDQFRSLSLIPCSDGAESSMPLLCDASPPELTTINMFWNDLPGLLMNGKEFVRLVDIHKQIMPAKDTGILKKRCHMMGLHITNCTELQRDFLIRYMNAAKSKSTVIIAKDAAIMLIGFYVNPKSRSKGADDFELDMLMPPTKLTKPSAPHASRHQWSVASKLKQTGFPAAGSEPSAGSLSAGSDAGVTTAPEKHICRTTIPQPTREGTSTGNSNDFGLETGADVKRSERLRHKHICYADLIHGGIDDSDRRSGKLEGVQSTSAYDNTLADEDRSDFNTKGFSSSLSDSEQAELENLIREQKRRRLTLEEKLRLKLLRNCQKRSASIPSSKVELALKGTRRRLLKRAKRTRRLLVWKRNRKLPSTAGDLHTLEHCYAASPAQLTGGMSKHQNSADHHNPKSSEHHVTRNSHASASTSDSFTPSEPMSLTPKVVTSATKSTTVGVIHRDVTCRVNRRRRSQIGELVIHLYTSNDSPCIRCSNCREMLSVQQFLKHMHWRRGSDKLVRVTIAQKLHLQSSSRTPDNLAAWDEFQKKRGRFEGMPEAHHTETTSSFVAHRTPVATKEPSVIEDTAKMVHHPSTRHSSRVSKRKLLHPVEKYVFANTNAQSDASVILPSPDAKRRRLTTDVDDHRSSAVVGQQHVSTPTVNHSKFPQRQKSNLPSASREKGKAKRRSVVPSDRLLRVTTRRAQDSRPTSASTLD